MARIPVVRDLPRATLARIEQSACVIKYQAGEEIWDRGDATSEFSFLISGQIRLLAPVLEPRNLLVDVIETPGALVCVPAVCGAAPYCCHAVAGRATQLLVVPRAEFLGEGLSPVGSLLLQQATQRGIGLCRRIREVSGSKVEHRVAAVLLRLADEQGTASPEGVRLPKTLSRRDLAGLSGCATETFIREIGHLEELGAVSREGRALVIHMKILSDHVYGDSA